MHAELCFGCRWVCCFFFFKQKTAYEMRISDWSSDVCSSDLDILVCAHAHRMIVPHRLCGALESKPLAVGAIVDRPAGETFVETRDGDRHDDRHDQHRKTGDRKSTRLNSSH